MSQSQKGNLPPRRVNTAKSADRPASSAGSPNKASSMSGRSAGANGGRNAASRPPSRSGGYSDTRRPVNRNRNRYVEHKRDPFPYVMGGVIGALVVGLMMVMFLIGSSTSGGNQNNNQGGAGVTTLPQANNGNPQAQTTTISVGTTPPQIEATRMPIEEFITLYSDPAKRPIIVDVRAKQAYDEGHIAGAISIPDAETESRLSELPKDKLIVAYCQ
ncbi:MAG TPA: rhodanese-like domain-containing protein [Chloroflexia bacterium]|nr:rhodanese-like domain-containing protein [Chloroflexia bacterium]